MNLATQLWLGKLANLNVARTGPRGIAPHKPLMLLTVFDLIESGDIPDGWVKYDVRLVSHLQKVGRTRLDPPTCRQRREMQQLVNIHAKLSRPTHTSPTTA